MPAWTEEYLAALAARDHVEKANQHVYDAYTRLADRIGQSQGQHERQPAQGASANAGPSGAKQTPTPPPLAPAATDDIHSTTRMRSDLAEAQKSRLHLQQQLTALTSTTASLRARLEASEGTIATLQRERATLGRRLRDRDEELKMKAKLLDDVQCEVVTFDLQLNMAEEKVEGLRKENEELVARWMARMRVEAEEMNKDMEF